MEVESRVGFDSNPLGTSGATAPVLGGADTLFFTGGATVALTVFRAAETQSQLKLGYDGDVTRFERTPAENFSTHRLALSGQGTLGGWRFSGEASSLFVAGTASTPLSLTSVSADAISLWRERRRQWQHRLKLQAQTDVGLTTLCASVTRLAYDYQTNVIAGHVAFANRSDTQAALDFGWKRSGDVFWFAGPRAGHQTQDTVPLPNYQFDYSNDYYRIVSGVEARLGRELTLTAAAGPDFRHFTGAVDPRVFLGGRDRTSLWLEVGGAAKLTATIAVAVKAQQMSWLASTGKTAYLDDSAEAAFTWTCTPAWSARFTARVHRSDFFPAVRDDWETLCNAGLARRISNRTQLTLDVLRNRAWNHLGFIAGREFHRTVVSVGAATKL